MREDTHSTQGSEYLSQCVYFIVHNDRFVMYSFLFFTIFVQEFMEVFKCIYLVKEFVLIYRGVFGKG